MNLRELRPGEEPDPGAHVIEYDVTPGLHQWIGEQIDRRQAAAEAGSEEARWCAAHRKILEAHPYTEAVIPPGYGPHGAPFGCETCHDWDGATQGYGNCATILALAEGYGLDDGEDTDG
ncbi:MAG TPA: hypothetical protein VFY14_04045 [Streptomyces sp.]|nr:hypothetical protein [Streptomyces sp.]